MSDFTVVVEPREERGTNSNRRLRSGGEIPAVVYGGGRDTVAIKVDEKLVREFLSQAGNENAVFLLKLGDSGKSRHAMIRDLQIDSVERTITHIDFQRVLMDEKIKVMVAIHVDGLAEGVKNQGGVMDFPMREIEVECLPGDIPAQLVIDVNDLEVGQHVEAGEVEIPENVELITDPGRVVLSVAHSRVAEDVDEAAAEDEEVGLIEEVSAEPEVIGRTREEEEDEDDD